MENFFNSKGTWEHVKGDMGYRKFSKRGSLKQNDKRLWRSPTRVSNWNKLTLSAAACFPST